MKEIQKVLNDTLKDRNGKYSRRSLTMFVSFSIGCLCGIYIVVSDLFLPREINSYAWLVVGSLLAAGTGQAILIEKEKQRQNTSTNNETPQ